jgi:hypothetical protein
MPSKLATERNIGDFLLSKADDLTPSDYVLDGQKRLTAITHPICLMRSDGG